MLERMYPSGLYAQHREDPEHQRLDAERKAEQNRRYQREWYARQKAKRSEA